MDASDSRGDVRRQISSVSHLDNNGAGMSIKKLFHDSKEEDERGRESGGEEGTCPLGRSNNAREISGDMADLSWRRIVVTWRERERGPATSGARPLSYLTRVALRSRDRPPWKIPYGRASRDCFARSFELWREEERNGIVDGGRGEVVGILIFSEERK